MTGARSEQDAARTSAPEAERTPAPPGAPLPATAAGPAAEEEAADSSQPGRPPFYGARGLELVRGSGVWVEDAQGRRYLDATSMYGIASLGHAHPVIADAIAEQARRLGACFASYDNDVRSAYLAELAALTAPLGRAFLTNSGTEAVEAALKLARFATGRQRILATTRAFHGRTFGALSATFRASHRRAFEPLVPAIEHVRFDAIDELDQRLGDDVAAFIVEPIQGEGGVHPASEAYLQAAERFCRERGALFVVDEVQTGFARTGAWFAFQAAGVEPDVLCLAKGIAAGFPCGATVFGPRVGDVAAFAHGSTFGGNPLACAAARATLATMRALDLPLHVAERGAELRQRLEALAAGNARVRAVRGRGLLLGIELSEPAGGIVRTLQERGVLALTAGANVLRLLPPLVIDANEIDLLASAVAEALA